MELKQMLKVTLCVLSVVFAYLVDRYNMFWLIPMQMLIVALVIAI